MSEPADGRRARQPPVVPPGALDRRGVAAATVLHLGVASFGLAAMGGAWAAPEPASAQAAIRAVLNAIGVYALVVALSRRREWWRSVALVSCLAGAVLGAYFLMQYRHIVTVPKLAFADALGRATSAPFPDTSWWSPFPNSLASGLDGLLWVSIGLAVARGSAPLRVTAAMSAGVIATAIGVSASRGSWVACAAAAVVWIVATSRRIPKPPVRLFLAGVLAAFAAVTVAAALPGTPWWLRLMALIDRPDRIAVYAQALTLARDVAFTGIGAGEQFAGALSKYVLLIEVPYLTYSHMLPLDLWLEFGLTGLATWASLAVGTAAVAAAGERAGLGRRFRGAWIGLLAVHVHGLIDARQSVDPWTWTPFFVLAGLVAGACARRRVRLSAVGATAPVWALLIIAASVAIGRGGLRAPWYTNRGAVAQARADLASGTDPNAREYAHQAARDQWAKALALAPADPSALRRLGLLELQEDRFAEAGRALSRAWAVDPSDIAIRKGYGLAMVWAGDAELAVTLLAPIAGEASELNTWSQWRASRGETELALRAAAVSLRIDPAQEGLADYVRTLRSAGALPPR